MFFRCVSRANAKKALNSLHSNFWELWFINCRRIKLWITYKTYRYLSKINLNCHVHICYWSLPHSVCIFVYSLFTSKMAKPIKNKFPIQALISYVDNLMLVSYTFYFASEVMWTQVITKTIRKKVIAILV